MPAHKVRRLKGRNRALVQSVITRITMILNANERDPTRGILSTVPFDPVTTESAALVQVRANLQGRLSEYI